MAGKPPPHHFFFCGLALIVSIENGSEGFRDFLDRRGFVGKLVDMLAVFAWLFSVCPQGFRPGNTQVGAGAK